MSIITIVSIFIGPVLAFGIIFLIWKSMSGASKENQRILQTGMPAQARVLQLQHTGSSVSFGAHRHLQLILVLEVHLQGQPPYQVQSQQLISELQIPSLQPGAWIQIAVDRSNPQKIAIGQAQGGGAPNVATPGGAPGAYGQPAGAYGQPAGAYGQPAMGAYGQPFGAPNVGDQVNRGMKRALIMTAVISVVVMVPLLAVFVDWSAFGLSSDPDAPKGGYCKALVRCCKKVHGSAGQCDNYANLPGSGCKSAYDTYKKSAKATGKTCD